MEINVFLTLSVNCLKNLTLTLEEEVSILDKYRLVPNELLFIRILLILQDENDEDLFGKYITVLKNSGINLRELISTLQDKEIILKSYKIPKEGQTFDPFLIPINKNFIKNLYKCSFELGKELFEVYPQFGTINGSLVGIRSVSRKFDSLEDAYFKYGKAIGWSVERHNHIIDLVNWSKDYNIINYTLATFIVDNRWLELEALRNGDNANINYESVKML